MKQISQSQMRMLQYGIEKRRLAMENLRLKQEIERERAFDWIVGESPKMKEIFRLVRSIADTDLTVTIEGETGTGKELVARAIHLSSQRKDRKFVAVNCGALSETLLESELFGHERGAFTGAISQRRGIFENADGGTLFLDEIGEISPSTQVKILRILERGEFQRVGASDCRKVDVRIIAATNQNLELLIERGTFRKDLYYRLHVFPITLPPLRERPEDIPLLIYHFIQQQKGLRGHDTKGITPEALALLTTYGWPGNVRELENVIQRMLAVDQNGSLDVDDLPAEIRGFEFPSVTRPANLKEVVQKASWVVERRLIQETLGNTRGNVTRAAKALGVSRATLQNKMRFYSLSSLKH
jgi:Nif-specific regulatory protein